MKKTVEIYSAIFIITLISFGFNSNNYQSIFVQLNIDKNDTLIKWTNLEDVKNEFSEEDVLLKIDNLNLNHSFHLKESKVFRFTSLKPQTRPYLVYITPGDSITYNLNVKGNIIFKGKNAAHYNFYTKLFELNLLYPKYDREQGLAVFKKECELIFQKRQLFLEQYSRTEKVSVLFSQKIRDILKFEYLNWILNRSVPSEDLRNNPEYLSQVDLKIFNMSNQNDNPYFYLALMRCLDFNSIVKSNSLAYSKEHLIYQLNLIDEKLIGDVKDYAIVKTIIENYDHLRSGNSAFLKEIIDKKQAEVAEPYKVRLRKIQQELEKLETNFPKEILQSKLVDLNGKTVSFEDALTENGNIKIIDFWASWCAPCIEEIKNSSKFRNRLTKENKIEILYFSIDESSEKWKKKVSALQSSGMSHNQFLLLDSNLKSFFNISSIPRYIILDHSNRVFMVNAPSPNDSFEFNKLIKQLDSLRLHEN